MTSANKPATGTHCLSLGAQVSEGGFATGAEGRQHGSSVKLFTTFALLAASPTTIAQAQQSAEPAPLPPVTVETTAKKKATSKAAAKKKAAPTQAASPAPQPPTTESAGDVATEPGANPYANPDAPYQVQQSGSSKLTQPLADTPRTITAIPKDVISDKGAHDLRELARQVPGVSITSGEGGSALQQFNIRGFNARNDIFVDGIRDPGNIGRDVFSVEQLEIYKGPAGTLSGRATPGGAFNFITKQPSFDEDFYEVEATIGTDETFRTTIDANKVFTPAFSARANILYDQHEVAGRDFTEDERWGGLLSAAIRPSRDLQINLDYYRVRRDGMPDAGVPVSLAHGVPWTEVGVPRDTFYGQLNLDYLTEESDVGTAKIVAKLSEGITLTNTTRYGENLNAYIMTTPRPQPVPDPVAGGGGGPQVNLGGPMSTGTAQRFQETTLFANQTLLNAKFQTGFLRHDVVTGIEYTSEKIDRLNHAFSPGGRVHIPVMGDPDPYRNSRVLTGISRQFKADIENVGVFIDDTVHLTDQWIINGGVRFDDFSRDQVGSGTNTAKVDQDLFSWHAGIVYKPIPIASFYAAVATAESPIGNEIDSNSSEYNGLNANNAHLPPEETTGYEVGTKWELLGGRLLATAALFRTTKDNARTNRANNGASNGKYRSQGIELGIAGNITDAWSVFGGAVFLDTEVLESDPDAAGQREVGRKLANVPHTQFSLLSKYKLTDQFTIGGQAIYQSELYTGHYAVNDHAYRSVPYWRFDAFAEYEIDDHWSVEVSGLNLTDELYYDAVYQNVETWALVAPGRAGYLSVKWKY